MSAPVRTAIGAEVSLDQMLAAREQRAARQASALACFNKPIVSMTVVMPGPVKDGWLSRRVLSEALKQLEAMSDKRSWRVLSREVLWRETGPEALYVIDAEARMLKSATVALEENQPIGRLWDLDVLTPGRGLLSRQELGFRPRRCLVCGQPAHACGRSRLHPLEELLSTIARIVHDHVPRSVN
ncbi:holo-ACP synthase [Bradyrhizobium sp. GM0.4]|uniref:citrate lyase holo-[acyl-carrier protein] synthase n=1 Tax=unclassified Bradyrhizobium TaxID=2631580 RepID=UPI001FFA34F1|nr:MULTISPECIES: citrate lyase holo-[acyl-carrier protein] synthase [unclassified Bradyrhizobium]MCK1341569.1 citrate lyase holo-[acyl-carrier protein] synthase [Bradyrhizobium sp. 38]MCK1480598.1 citrate lyase holo-[acyl-carrier protein] synthase [Bradyrhizobium sp. 197]MCK1778900.1 citrate lyase holo-[acyl-carrier protein] synthase [Bradyrhizobium sp. 132]